mgnify:CR=1 FL=1
MLLTYEDVKERMRRAQMGSKLIGVAVAEELSESPVFERVFIDCIIENIIHATLDSERDLNVWTGETRVHWTAYLTVQLPEELNNLIAKIEKAPYPEVAAEQVRSALLTFLRNNFEGGGAVHALEKGEDGIYKVSVEFPLG